MAENNKIYITANELAEMLGVSVGHAYKLIRKLNQELEKEGFLVIALGGRPRERYTEEERQLLRDIAQLKGTLQRSNG